MIILDTNVLLELMKSKPDELVVCWKGKHKAINLFITTLTQAKIL
jgi:toxin FitB